MLQKTIGRGRKSAKRLDREIPHQDIFERVSSIQATPTYSISMHWIKHKTHLETILHSFFLLFHLENVSIEYWVVTFTYFVVVVAGLNRCRPSQRRVPFYSPVDLFRTEICSRRTWRNRVAFFFAASHHCTLFEPTSWVFLFSDRKRLPPPKKKRPRKCIRPNLDDWSIWSIWTIKLPRTIQETKRPWKSETVEQLNCVRTQALLFSIRVIFHQKDPSVNVCEGKRPMKKILFTPSGFFWLFLLRIPPNFRACKANSNKVWSLTLNKFTWTNSLLLPFIRINLHVGVNPEKLCSDSAWRISSWVDGGTAGLSEKRNRLQLSQSHFVSSPNFPPKTNLEFKRRGYGRSWVLPFIWIIREFGLSMFG